MRSGKRIQWSRFMAGRPGVQIFHTNLRIKNQPLLQGVHAPGRRGAIASLPERPPMVQTRQMSPNPPLRPSSSLPCSSSPRFRPGLPAAEDGFVPLFNGRDLSGWKAVNTAPSTWSFNDEGYLVCSGKPVGEIRTERMYQNFILEIEWRHLVPKATRGSFVWADDITAKGQPFHRGVEVQVLEKRVWPIQGSHHPWRHFPHPRRLDDTRERTGRLARVSHRGTFQSQSGMESLSHRVQ